MEKKQFIKNALAGIVAVGLSTATAQALTENKENMEKCYGVVKAKMNDCASATHSCAGQAMMDGAGADWVYVPNGTCNKIVNGSMTALTEPTKPATEETTPADTTTPAQPESSATTPAPGSTEPAATTEPAPATEPAPETSPSTESSSTTSTDEMPSSTDSAE